MACECCGTEKAQPLYVLGMRGQVVRHALALMPDAALCDACRGIVEWALRRHWIREGENAKKARSALETAGEK